MMRPEEAGADTASLSRLNATTHPMTFTPHPFPLGDAAMLRCDAQRRDAAMFGCDAQNIAASPSHLAQNAIVFIGHHSVE